ncbi:MAG TPA: hypothetical protein VFE14_12360 [Micromonosporaceae bacterium]|nr:hypothetical protein [Micromonosporaceae bacterium]
MAATMAAAVVAVLAAVPIATGGFPGDPPASAHRGPTVPGRVYPPWLGQDTVLQSPPGAASILVSGEGSLIGADTEWYHFEGRSLVVSQSGRYRLVRTMFQNEAGRTMLLSPDGRFLTGENTLEGAGGQQAWPGWSRARPR